MNKIIGACALILLAGCQSTENEVIKEPQESVYKAIPDISESVAGAYLLASTPLNEDFIQTPFLFDGDKLLLNRFDISAWRNKRFITVKGQKFWSGDRFIVDMESGEIRAVSEDFQFKGLLQSLLIKIMPLKGLVGTPRFLVLTNMVEEEGDASVLVIEDPKTSKVHGFIESALVDASFSSSLFRVDQ